MKNKLTSLLLTEDESFLTFSLTSANLQGNLSTIIKYLNLKPLKIKVSIASKT